MTSGVSTSNEDCLAPRWLTLPLIPSGNQTAQAPNGSVGLSGANLVMFNGSNWVIIS